MNLNPVQFVRTRTRHQWQESIRGVSIESRAWIQENGEAAAGIGFFVGIVLVVLMKVMVLLLALGVIVGFFFHYLAPETQEEVDQWDEYYRGQLNVSTIVEEGVEQSSTEVPVQSVNGHEGEADTGAKDSVSRDAADNS